MLSVRANLTEAAFDAQRLNQIAVLSGPTRMIMDLPVAGETQSQTAFKIIELLSISSCEMMHLGGDLPTDPALEMLPQEREAQPAILAQAVLANTARRPEPFLASAQGRLSLQRFGAPHQG
jgi:hypothetical protein